MSNVLDSASQVLKDHSWSWTSIGDSLLSVASYVVYFLLYISVFFFDAAIVYCLVLLYIFSPILIVFYILPQTAGLTSGLFRSLFEVALWKIVFSVLGTLLWSTALHSFEAKDQNFITQLALTLMLAFSILLTPLVVKALISGGLSSVATQTAGLAAVGMTAGFASPAALSGLAKTGTKKAGSWAIKQGKNGFSALRGGSAKKYQKAKAASAFAKSYKSNSKENEKD